MKAIAWASESDQGIFGLALPRAMISGPEIDEFQYRDGATPVTTDCFLAQRAAYLGGTMAKTDYKSVDQYVAAQPEPASAVCNACAIL
jgi:hypothetical protein